MSDPSQLVDRVQRPDGPSGRPATVGGAGRRRLRVAGAIAAVSMLVVVGLTAQFAGDDESDRAADRAADRAVDLPSPNRSGVDLDVVLSVGRTQASIGSIDWRRVDGDRTTLPAGVVGRTGSSLVGRGNDGALVWSSDDDGVVWQIGEHSASIDVGGHRWSVTGEEERRQLIEETDTGRALARIVDSTAVRDGMDVSWQVPDSRPRVVEVRGEIFARLDRREDVAWRIALGLDPSEDYRVRVGDGVDDLWADPSADRALPTVELTARRDGDRVILADRAGVEVWSVEAASSSEDVLDALRPRVSSEWLRWTGAAFETIDHPWAPADRVDVTRVEHGLVAVATISRRAGPRLWSTRDGMRWEVLDAPAQPSPSSPMPVESSADEAIVTISDGAATTHWSTMDGVTFERLADVPGIDERSRGTFGWIAPDPRGSPRIRVSADGVEWDTVDLSDQLGFDGARWDTQVDAIAIGSSIYVVATHGNSRILLVGAVGRATP
ncbi:MAG: hypothetical protein ABIP17_14190 [Ilumatobacteraceae bacterium]